MTSPRRDLEDAYRATAYCVQTSKEHFHLRIDCRHPGFEIWLKQHQISSWAFITPANPRSEQLPERENRARLHTLIQRLKASEQTFLPAIAQPDSPNWPEEQGVLLIGMPESDLIHLARELDQLAIVTGTLGKAPRLIWTDDA